MHPNRAKMVKRRDTKLEVRGEKYDVKRHKVQGSRLKGERVQGVKEPRVKYIANIKCKLFFLLTGLELFI